LQTESIQVVAESEDGHAFLLQFQPELVRGILYGRLEMVFRMESHLKRKTAESRMQNCTNLE
jgi:hypothetical protein